MKSVIALGVWIATIFTLIAAWGYVFAMFAENTTTYLPLVSAARTSTPLPTAIRLPTATIAPSPTPYPTAQPRTCSPTDPNWRGMNDVYPFCVARDLTLIAPITPNPFYCPCRVITKSLNEWITVEWDIYGVQSMEIAVDPSSQLFECKRGGGGGFRQAVANGGRMSFNASRLETGLYKIELYPLRLDNVRVGHNEIFICII